MELQEEAVAVLIATGLALLAIVGYLQKTQRIDAHRFTGDDAMIVFVVLAAVGLVCRVVCAYNLPGYESDMNCFRAWARDAYQGGLAEFYSGAFFADYPPLYVYILYILGGVQQAAGLDIMGGDYAVLLRLPAMIADLLLAVFAYRVAGRRWGRNTALTVSALILLNPALMINSAVWGQIDSIAALGLVGCLYLLYRKKYEASVAVFMLTFLMKPQALLVAPVLLYALLSNLATARNQKRAWGRCGLCLGIACVIWFLVPLPFGYGKEPLWLVHRYLDTVGEYGQAGLNAFNLYGLTGLNFQDAASSYWLGLPVSTWGFIFAGVLCVYTAWLMYRNRSRWFAFAGAAFMVAGAFTFVHGMHERYLYAAPILLLFAYLLSRDFRLMLAALFFFGISVVNQGVSLDYYEQWIPQQLMAAMSVLELAAFAYLAYSVTSIALHGAEVQRLRGRDPDTARYDWKKSSLARLERPLGYQKCDRKDLCIVLLLCALYSCVAFANLGTFDIPVTSATVEGNTVVAFEKPEHITTFKYYADYGEGAFDIQASDNGIDYENVTMTGSDYEGFEIVHEVKNLYKWQVYTMDITAQYIRIVDQGQPLPILEIAFFGPDGTQIIPVSVMRGGEEIEAWTDEQEMAPYEKTYLTDFYFDEIYHVRTAYENIHLLTPYEITHPPLGKILLAIGIELFGMNSFGWRFMGTLAGVAMIPVMYVLGRMLFRKRKYAVFACVLLCADFMHFAQTRIGTIDSYSVLWIMTTYLFMFRYAQMNFNRQPLRRTLPSLFFSGLFFGIGAATKWLCLYAGLGLFALFVMTLVQRYQEYRACRDEHVLPEVVRGFHRKFWLTWLFAILFFLVLPACIYVASYTPYTLVQDGGAYGFQEILGNQSYMLNYHAYLNPDHVHPFSSKWYTWPLDVRPVLFFSNQTETTIATLSTMGNPLLWWSGLVAEACLIIQCVRHKKYRSYGLLFCAVAALSEFAPWWFITREVFIYHYFAVVPFLILFIVYWLRNLERDYTWGRKFGYIYVCACAAFFAIFYPVITGVPAPKDYINAIRWLQSWPFY